MAIDTTGYDSCTEFFFTISFLYLIINFIEWMKRWPNENVNKKKSGTNNPHPGENVVGADHMTDTGHHVTGGRDQEVGRGTTVHGDAVGRRHPLPLFRHHVSLTQRRRATETVRWR